MEKDKHVLAKNVIVLVQAKSNDYSDKKNARIQRRNEAWVEQIESHLNDFFGNATNTKGEVVEFRFNVSSLEVENTAKMDDKTARNLSISEGLIGKPAFEGDVNNVAPATIISTGFSIPSATTGNGFITLEEFIELAHEMGHTFMTRGQKQEENKPGTGGLMDDPPQHIRQFEVDKMLEDAKQRPDGK